MRHMINRRMLRELILRRWKELCPSWPMPRVSEKAYARYDRLLRKTIDADIRRHPSLGRTFTPEEIGPC